jgi:hypothetical protein
MKQKDAKRRVKREVLEKLSNLLGIKSPPE